MKYYIDIIKEKCIGCGACILIAKGIFIYDNNYKAKIIKKDINDEEAEKVEISAKVCPTNAIIFEKIQ